MAQGLLGRFLGRLRFPQLFLLMAGLFLFDLFIPDLIPFLDEIFLGLFAALFALIKNRRPDPAPGRPAGEKDITPR